MLRLFKPSNKISEEQEDVILSFLEARIARLAAKAINHTVEFVRKEQRPPSEEEIELILKEVLK